MRGDSIRGDAIWNSKARKMRMNMLYVLNIKRRCKRFKVGMGRDGLEGKDFGATNQEAGVTTQLRVPRLLAPMARWWVARCTETATYTVQRLTLGRIAVRGILVKSRSQEM